MTKEFIIHTRLNSKEVNERIQRLLNKKWGIPFLFRKLIYKGNFSDTGFVITSQFDNPPIVVNGKLNENEIEVTVKWDSVKSAYKGLVLGLGFPIVFMILFFIIYDNPKSILSYVFCTMLLAFFYLFQKIFVAIYYQEPNPKKVIKDLKRVLA